MKRQVLNRLEYLQGVYQVTLTGNGSSVTLHTITEGIDTVEIIINYNPNNDNNFSKTIRNGVLLNTTVYAVEGLVTLKHMMKEYHSLLLGEIADNIYTFIREVKEEPLTFIVFKNIINMLFDYKHIDFEIVWQEGHVSLALHDGNVFDCFASNSDKLTLSINHVGSSSMSYFAIEEHLKLVLEQLDRKTQYGGQAIPVL